MSYPSMNARSKALPPVTPVNKRRTFNLHSLVRRNSHDLPLMKPTNLLDTPSDVSSSPEGRVRHDHPCVKSASTGYVPRLSTFSASSSVEDDYPAGRLSSSSDGIPIYFGGEGGNYKFLDIHPPLANLSLSHESEDEEQHKKFKFTDAPSSPSPMTTLFPPSITPFQPRIIHPSSNLYPVSTNISIVLPEDQSPFPLHPSTNQATAPFSAILLSKKTVELPPQPVEFQNDSSLATSLIQLQVAGSTFIVPIESIKRYSSYLARFVVRSEESDSKESESDGTVSEAETDFDDNVELFGSSFNHDLTCLYASPTPMNLRASSKTKLQKLGILPALDISTSFLSLDRDSLPTPRATKTTFNRHSPSRPPRPATPLMSPNRASLKFFNILLCRSPEPYVAIDFFFSTGMLLPSLRSLLEGENTAGGCPLCGEAQRVRKLREVEAEATWLGLESLVRVCKAERKRNDGEERPIKKLGDGWF